MLHFVEYTENDISFADNASIHSLVLFIFPHAGAESEDALSHAIDKKLNEIYGICQDRLMERFMFITDSAANIPRIVGRYVSSALVPTSEWWMPCICHQLNNVMKQVIGDLASLNVSESTSNAQNSLTRNKTKQNDESEIRTDLKL